MGLCWARRGYISPKKWSCFPLCLFSFAVISSLGANPPNWRGANSECWVPGIHQAVLVSVFDSLNTWGATDRPTAHTGLALPPLSVPLPHAGRQFPLCLWTKCGLTNVRPLECPVVLSVLTVPGARLWKHFPWADVWEVTACLAGELEIPASTGNRERTPRLERSWLL